MKNKQISTMNKIILSNIELEEINGGSDSGVIITIASFALGPVFGVLTAASVLLYNNYGAYKAGVSAGFDSIF